MAPLARYRLYLGGVSGFSDSIAAWTLRDKASISVRTG